jgi:hypothetical protein
MRILSIVVAFSILLTSTAVYAQLPGSPAQHLQVLDSTTSEPLAGVAISIRRDKDSTNLYTSPAGQNGEFQLPVLTTGLYYLVLDAEGYKTKWIRFDIGQGKLNLPLTIALPKQIDELQSVTVHAPPNMEIHGDTTSYLAACYHTRPYATLAELLNKLPGVEVDGAGHASVMGKVIRQVLLNGKPYFSDDPTIAILNFPRDLVYRIEILEDRSDEAKFTGVDDGVRILTINIITSREVKRTIFSNGSGGFGTQGLYSTTANTHYQSGSKTAGVILSDANIPVGDNPSPPPGIYQTSAACLTLSDSALDNKGFWNVSYSLIHANGNVDRQSDIQYLASSGPVLQTTNSNQDFHRMSNQTGSLRLFFRPARFDQLTLDADLNGTRSANSDSLNSATDSSSIPINGEASRVINQTRNNHLRVGLQWGHRFARKGRTLYVNLNSDHINTILSGSNNYGTAYYLPAHDSTITALQRSIGPTTHNLYSLSVDYTEPISSFSSLQLHYQTSMTTAVSSYTATQYDSLTHNYQPDSPLSSNFSAQTRTDYAGLLYDYGQGRPFSFTAGTSVVKIQQVSQNFGVESIPPLNTLNLNPVANLQWTIRKGQRLSLNYSGATGHPTLQQLQPVINNANPLHVQVGNPDLRTSFTHNLNIELSSSDPAPSGQPRVWWINISSTLDENAITSTSRINPLTGADTITPVNINGNYSVFASGGYSIPVSIVRSTLNMNTNLSDNHQVGMIDNEKSLSTNRAAGAGFSWKSNLRKALDGNLAASATYRFTTDPLSPASNQHFWLYTLTASLTAYTDNGWQLSSQLQYTSYAGLAPGLNPTIALWSATLSRHFLKKRQAELKLILHDILNQGVAISHSITPLYIQDSRTQIITRYLMLTFAYHFRDLRLGAVIPPQPL